MSRLVLFALAVCAILVTAMAFPFTVSAVNIDVTAQGAGPTLDPPTNFTVSRIHSDRARLTWTNATGSDNTTIVRKIGSYPSNRSDGVTIYCDNGTTYDDTGVDLSQTGYDYYYKAWSQNTDGYSDTAAFCYITHEAGTVTSLIGSATMAEVLVLCFFFIVGCLLAIKSAASRRMDIKICSAACWLVILVCGIASGFHPLVISAISVLSAGMVVLSFANLWLHFNDETNGNGTRR